jgi:hypothetical protein
VTKYFNSDQWKRLSKDTQSGRRRSPECFRADHGDKPLDSLQAIHIKALMDGIDGTAHSKRNWLKHIAGMFLFAEEDMIRSTTPAVASSDRSHRRRTASIAGPIVRSRSTGHTGLTGRSRAS